jgi:hypothetical protein
VHDFLLLVEIRARSKTSLLLVDASEASYKMYEIGGDTGTQTPDLFDAIEAL